MFRRADFGEKTAELILNLDIYGNYSHILKSYRKKHKLTQKELADIVGVDHTALRSWEQNLSKPPYHIWSRYKHMFDDV